MVFRVVKGCLGVCFLFSVFLDLDKVVGVSNI